MGPRFSIVVPCYNEARYVADTVNSLRDQTFAGSYEIIVVDNNCTDETADIARGLGARVVGEKNPGVCCARQKGTEESAGEIVISADADTRYPPDWLAKIDRSFGADERIAAVSGPCRYVKGPLWGRVYARILFGGVHLVYRMTGRTPYVTATNIAFRKTHWSGYEVHLTQGGDELNLLRDLRGKGRVVYDHTNSTYTSSRRLTRGVLHGFFVTLLVYYLLAYFLNRLFKRRVIGCAPAYRDERTLLSRRLQTAGVAALSGFLLLLPFTQSRDYIVDRLDSVVGYVTAAIPGMESPMTFLRVVGALAACFAAYWAFMSPYSQAFGRYPYRGERRNRVVALTFDDGPNEPYTSQIADYLSSKHIRATFFQVGKCVERFPESTAKMHAAGHVIGNHSLAHGFHAYLVPGRLAREVAQTQEILRGRLGRAPALFRSPWLWRQPILLRMVRRNSLQPVSGEFCHALEVFQPDGARIARRAIAKTRPGSILIFHDGFDGRGGNRSETVRAVQITTEELLRRGYCFVTVDELLGVPAYQEDSPAAACDVAPRD